MSESSAKHGGALIDGHTPIHAIVGFVAGALGVDPHLAVATFIGARIVEAALREGPAHALFAPESGQSLGNEMTDLLFEMGGLHFGQALRQKITGEAPAVHGLGYFHQHVHNPYALRAPR